METQAVATLEMLGEDDADTQLTTHTDSHIMIVRPARSHDIPEIADLIEPFVEEGKLLSRTYNEFDELLPNFFVAVAEESDGYNEPKILGCAALEIYSPKLAEIRSLAVSKDAQGRGIGKLLVDACIARARERGILEVMAITSSDGFFQACGFDYTLPGAKRALFVQTRDLPTKN